MSPRTATLFFLAALGGAAHASEGSESDCENPEYDDVCDETFSVTYRDGQGMVRGVHAINRHGVRVGYSYVQNLDKVTDYEPHMLVLGYEMNQVYGTPGAQLNLLLIANGMIAGLNQAVAVPSANLITGIELRNGMQLGVGANVSPADPSGEENYIHMIAAVGTNRRVGSFTIPLHFSIIPDPNGFTRAAFTSGVNF